ncbi:MAG: radical SAM protein [Lachnospiraceae bacterium]|nr:radical SAM protein [Lachnospiraceae bacterium]
MKNSEYTLNLNALLPVNEIFGSIDGEGITAGGLATFIRLCGCNMKCSYCDTTYALSTKDADFISIENVLDEVDKNGYKHVTLTGGEPLIHENSYYLIKALLKKGYIVNIETNGSIPISKYQLDNVIITMDYKCPSSNTERLMYLDNLELLRENDVLKFVCMRNDLSKVKEIISHYNIKSYIYLSPVFNEIQPLELVEFLKELHLSHINTDKIRVQVQLHKIIWNPDQRGV